MIPSTWFVTAGAVLLTLSNTITASPPCLITCLKNINSDSESYLTTPSSPAYTKDRQGFNHVFDFKPAAIYHAANNADAAAAIKCARLTKVPVAPRSGGHSYEGYCEGGKDGVLVIDLNLMQGFDMDDETGVATFGAGSRLGPMYAKVWAAGEYLLAAGTCATVGVGGHALGGGIGLTSRKYGMLSDNVVGMTMIDAAGDIKKISSSSNKDLFWALRGAGGGSFGLVTEFQIQAHKAPSVVTSITIEWPLAKSSKVINAYGKWVKTATEDITTSIYMSPGGMSLSGTYLGSRTDAKSAIAELLDLIPKPDYTPDFKELTWLQEATNQAYLKSGTLANPVVGDAHYNRGRALVYRKPLSQEERDIIFKYLSNPPDGDSASYIIIDGWGGKIDSPNKPSAFDNHRGVLYGIQFVSEWTGSDSTPALKTCSACVEWSHNFAKAMQAAYSSGPLEGYQNYIERDFPNSLQAYYGKSLPRLKQVKKAADPHNVFTFAQAIPLP